MIEKRTLTLTPVLDLLLGRYRNSKIAILLALLGALTPYTWPLVGLHKFYLRQPLWGCLYLVLFATPIPHIASIVDALWYFILNQETFDRFFNPDWEASNSIAPEEVNLLANALRELEKLRQEGLLSEYEFEQKRRQLLDRTLPSP